MKTMLQSGCINRRRTESLKWNHYPDDIIPLWIADMDFPVSEQIQVALRKRIEHPIFGYTLPAAELETVLMERIRDACGVVIEKEWIVWLPGCVSGFNVAARAFGTPKGQILTNVPSYPPFLQCGENNGHYTVPVALKNDGRRWRFDFKALKMHLSAETYMFLLCNPHNPTGRLWERDELDGLAGFCLENGLIICSDEIHCDLVLDKGRTHIPMFSLSDETAQKTITLMSPSKTFNIAGLNCAFALIPNGLLRDQYRKAMSGLVPYVNIFGFEAALAAYRDSREWQDMILCQLLENSVYVFNRINAMPGLTMTPVEATYLAWIDARETGLDDPYGFFLGHGVALSDGKQFGCPGYVRLNFACPQDILCLGLDRMENALLCL